jgi:hypothetical protein
MWCFIFGDHHIMNKTILLAAVAALAISSSAFATDTGSANLSGVATSQVSGGVFSSSTMTGDGAAAHGAFASSFNTTNVSASGNSRVGEAGVNTAASTIGGTQTLAGGFGAGSASAGSDQYGNGASYANANTDCTNVAGFVNVTSLAAIGTTSNAAVTGTGLSGDRTDAFAFNASEAQITGNSGAGHAGTSATGSSIGADGTVASDFALGHATSGNGSALSSGATSVQAGSYSGTVTATFDTTMPGATCTSSSCGGGSNGNSGNGNGNGNGNNGNGNGNGNNGNGNNGNGNGQQPAPGNSGSTPGSTNGNTNHSGHNPWA